MPVSIDLHVKCPFKKKWKKKKKKKEKGKQKRKRPFFFSSNFHIVFGGQIAIFYQIFKSGSSKNF